ncbi:MAG TPA: sigma-70 family RNA polymerase sigma factor [Planctomycetota bacterium]|nr:sigma-70 family RNA polymerase sigma factor [Planctomycetota bacterium]
MATTLSLVDTPAPASPRVPELVREALVRRGVLLEPLPDESPSKFSERIDTAMMALFRDTHDTVTFEALYARTGGAVLEWLQRLLARERCGLDPLEVLQDTFVNVYKYSTRFRDERPESFRVWVRTIAANALRRARSEMPRRADSLGLDKPREPEALRAEPTRRLDEEEERRQLALMWMVFLDHYLRAYAGLSPRDQLALALVEVEGLSYAQAGARLAVGQSNMKMIMFRARARLLLRMDDSMGCARPEAAPRNPPLRRVG